MLIKATDLIKAADAINTVASLDKATAGILMRVSKAGTELYFSDGRSRAINVRVENVLEIEDYLGDVIFDFGKFISVVNAGRSSGHITVDFFDMKMSKKDDNTGICTVKIVKKLVMNKGGQDVESVVAVNSYDIGWTPAEKASTKQAALIRKIAEDMYDTTGCMTWSTAELRDIVKNVTANNSLAVYMSKRYNALMSNSHNTQILAIAKGTDINVTLAISTKYLKALTDTIGYFESEQVYLTPVIGANGRPYSILVSNPDQTFSVYMGLTAENTNDVVFFSKAAVMPFRNMQASIITEVIVDALRGIASSIPDAKSGRIDLCFRTTGERTEAGYPVELMIKANNSGASTNDTYRIVCDGCYTTYEPADDGVLVSVPVYIANMLETVAKLCGTYTAIDIDDTDNRRTIRIGNIDTDMLVSAAAELKETPEYRSEHDGEDIHNLRLTPDERASIRTKSLDTIAYIPAISK